MQSTYSVPCVHAASAPLAAVLHLLELANGHGAEAEHLQQLVRTLRRRTGPLTHADHDPIREEGFERYTHGCDGHRRWWVVMWWGGRECAACSSEARLAVTVSYERVGAWRLVPSTDQEASSFGGRISPSTRSAGSRLLFLVSLDAAELPGSRKATPCPRQSPVIRQVARPRPRAAARQRRARPRPSRIDLQPPSPFGRHFASQEHALNASSTLAISTTRSDACPTRLPTHSMLAPPRCPPPARSMH